MRRYVSKRNCGEAECAYAYESPVPGDIWRDYSATKILTNLRDHHALELLEAANTRRQTSCELRGLGRWLHVLQRLSIDVRMHTIGAVLQRAFRGGF